MSDYSIFDVVGPNMIGPSSSHTAGACRIGMIAHKLAKDEINEVIFYLHGSFKETYKGHGTDKALVGGILGFMPDDKRIRTSFEIAKEKAIKFDFEKVDLGSQYHSNTVKIVLKTVKNKEISIVGSSIGGGNVKIVEINGLKVEFSGFYPTIIVKQRDLPGAAAHITNSIADNKINIAFMSIFRNEKGKIAFTVVEADDKIPTKVIDDIKSNKELIEDCFIVEL